MAGAKYITPLNFVRLGIAKADKHGVTLQPKFNVNWSLDEPEVLDALLMDIKNSLNAPRFGEYCAFERVFGDVVARSVGDKGGFAVPPPPNKDGPIIL